LPPEEEREWWSGSTDMGNVTRVPTIYPTTAIDCGDAVNHQPEFTAACVSPSADDAVRDGALALVCTALAAATHDEQRDRLIGGVSRRREVPTTAAGGAA